MDKTSAAYVMGHVQAAAKERRKAIADVYRAAGSFGKAAKQLGITRARVHQIVMRARLEELEATLAPNDDQPA